jgi:hypothetical protein
VIKVSTAVKKMACFLPGLGAPVSLYYAFTSKELRGTALKGLSLLPIAVLIVMANSVVPTTLALLAGAYIYWGLMALAGGWGFLAMLLVVRVLEKNIPIEQIVPIKQEAPELVPTASVSEILPDIDASAIISGIERLPKEEREELVATIITKKLGEVNRK